ncbi:MAG: hypothetical protein U0805_09265 [Pirellulales bacterium]
MERPLVRGFETAFGPVAAVSEASYFWLAVFVYAVVCGITLAIQHRARFTLRTLMIMMAITAALCGLMAYLLRR